MRLRRAGRWLIVGVADGLIPPEPVAVNVDPDILDTYVGDYEWSPTLVAKIRRRGDSLYEDLGGQNTSLSAENTRCSSCR